MRNDTGRFLILAHEKLNKINDLNTPSGPTIIFIYQILVDRFATRFANSVRGMRPCSSCAWAAFILPAWFAGCSHLRNPLQAKSGM